MEVNQTSFLLEALYFSKIKTYWQYKRLTRVKMRIAEKYSRHVVISNCMKIFKLRLKRKHDIEAACRQLKKFPQPMNEFILRSTVSPKISKVIYVVNFNRLRILRKYFNVFRKFIAIDARKN